MRLAAEEEAKRQAEEAQRAEEEKKQQDENQKRENEERKRQEEIRIADEEKKVLEEEKKKQQESKRIEEEKQKLEAENREIKKEEIAEDIVAKLNENDKLESVSVGALENGELEETQRQENFLKAQEELKLLEEARRKSEAEKLMQEEELKVKEGENELKKKSEEVDKDLNSSSNHRNDESEKVFNEQLEINQTEEAEIIKLNDNEAIIIDLNTKATPVDTSSTIANKKQQMKIKTFIHSNKYCADLNPLREVINHIEPYYSPFILLLPEDLQLLLLESTHFMGISLASCLIIVFLVSLSLALWLVMIRKKDQTKMVNNLKLNQAILELELTIKNLIYDKQTFCSKILEMEKEIETLSQEKSEIEEKLSELDEKQLKKDADERAHMQDLTKKYTNLEVKYENLVDKQKEKDAEFVVLREENSRIESNLKIFEDNKNNLIELDKYKELEEKLRDLLQENENCNEEMMKYKVDGELFEKQIENLQHEIGLRDKSIIVLQNYVAKSVNKSLPTINENEDNRRDGENDSMVNNVEELMNIANLQMKISELEQQLNVEGGLRERWEEEKAKFEADYKQSRMEYDEVRSKLDEAIVRVKRLETENKLCEELRVKDIERNVRKEFLLEAELKKKTSDAERAAHLLEQLRLKQERIQELEAQIGRIERATTNDRHNYEKQMHENRQVARKFEKECEEAKREAETVRKEAKLWKDKFNEIEQYKEKLIRPVPNKMSSFMQPIVNPNMNHQQSDSNDTSPQSKSVHESSIERERPPSASSNPGGYAPQMYNPNAQLPHGMSPTPMTHPMYMRGMPPSLYRPPFPPPTPMFPGRMPFDMYNNAMNRNTAPSPDMMSQYMNRLPGNGIGVPPIGMPGYPSPQRQMQSGTPVSSLQQNFNTSSSPGQQNTPYMNNNNANNNTNSNGM